MDEIKQGVPAPGRVWSRCLTMCIDYRDGVLSFHTFPQKPKPGDLVSGVDVEFVSETLKDKGSVQR